MHEGDPSEEIAQLEDRIEQLADVIERCRKVILFAKIAMALGAALLLAILLGAIRFDPTAMLAAITAVLGGVVLFGSNSSTAEQTAAALKTAEAERAELIGRMELEVVGDKSTLH